MLRKAVFLDRDGTLIYDVGYPSDPSKVELIPGVVAALKGLQAKGFLLIVISNQSGVGRGFFSKHDLDLVNNRFIEIFKQDGVFFDGIYYCLHAPWEQCQCRKPKPGMLYSAAKDLNIELEKSYMVGDKQSDVDAGLNAGCRALLINKLQYDSDFPASVSSSICFPDLLSASKWIIKEDSGK